jgi:polyisoprenyl-teichoic acid--peptidoglycan teichoic acid transferase
MTFKTRRIRKKPKLKPLKIVKDVSIKTIDLFSSISPKTKSYILGGFLIVLSFFIVFKVMVFAYNSIKDFNPKEAVFAFGEDLKRDENGYTNILLLGDGGHVRDGADLIDTIIVASLDYEKKALSMLSIPRDFYVKSISFPGKINEVYRNHKRTYNEDEDRLYGLFKEVAGEIANLDIQYYARLNFNAFVEIVDSINGITVDVQKSIYDPYYPNETDDGYTIFKIEKGLQEMDGETALKFVRSRKTTSDFDRSARQQQVIAAVREKAISKEILTSPKSIKNIYNAVFSNINTDISLREIISLAEFADSLERDRLVTKVIHDDPGREGGFLYTPEREFYNGLFVLIPFGKGYELIHKYSDIIFKNREVLWNPPKINILNGTKKTGIARNFAYQLNRFGFNIGELDNYFDEKGDKKYIEETVMFYYEADEDKEGNIIPKHKSTIEVLGNFINAIPIYEPKDEIDINSDITIILGNNYKAFLVN